MRRSVVAIFLGVLIGFSGANAIGRVAFSGTYTVNGNNPGVGAYKGTLTIVARGEVYDVHWAIANVQYAGVGVVVNDTLSVAYSSSDKSWIGVMAYRQRPDGSLEGRWAVQGRSGRPGTETAVRK